MAGILYFHAKKGSYLPDFNIRIKTLQSFLYREYSPYFKSIKVIRTQENTCLFFFNNDKDDCFYQDESGSWLGYEGNVFSLTSTTQYSPQELWHLYQKSGDQFVSQLDGHFVIKLYNAQQNRYSIITDFIRSRHNYFCETDDYIIITPFLLSTSVISRPELDFHAINEIMWRYYILSDRTVFKNVRRLSPATILSIKNGRVSKSCYWQFPDRPTSEKLDVLTNRFVESIRETARLLATNFKNPVSDLTLGQDSRIILAAFKSQNIPVVTTTYGKDDFLEVRKVRELSKKHHITNHTIQLNEDFTNNIWEYFKKSLLLGNGDEPGYLLGRILYMREMQSKFGDALINGAGGPFYKDCFWEETYILNLYREPKNIDRKRFLKLRPMNKNYRDEIFTDEYLLIKNLSSNYFNELLSNAINGYENCPVSMQIDKFALTHWQNYAIFSNSTANSLYNSFSPLLFRRNLEIGLPIPPRYRWNKSQFQRKVIYQLNPLLAKEKTDFGGINMVPKNLITAIPFYFKYAYKQTERYRNKIKTKLGINTKTWLQEAWDYKPIYNQLFNSTEHRRLLNGKLFISPLIKQDSWEDIILTYTDPDSDINVHQYEYLFKLTGIEFLFKSAQELYTSTKNNIDNN